MSGGEFQPTVMGVVSSWAAGELAALAVLVGAGVAAPPQAEKTTPLTSVAATNLDQSDIVASIPHRPPRKNSARRMRSHAVRDPGKNVAPRSRVRYRGPDPGRDRSSI